MSVLKILHYPDQRLRLIAKPVEKINKEIHIIVNNMIDTMYEEEGIGLAATQVNIQLQIIVINKTNQKEDDLILINPKIIDQKVLLVLKKDVYQFQNIVLLYHDLIILKFKR